MCGVQQQFGPSGITGGTILEEFVDFEILDFLLIIK